MAYANLEGLGWLAEDMQAWTAAHYEPKLRFNSTPVYSVTLAEDVDLSSGDFTIDVSDENAENFVIVILAEQYSATQSVNCKFARGTANPKVISISNITSSDARRISVVRYIFRDGFLDLEFIGATQGALQGNKVGRANTATVPSEPTNPVTSIALSGTAVLPTGMSIAVYAATEV